MNSLRQFNDLDQLFFILPFIFRDEVFDKFNHQVSRQCIAQIELRMCFQSIVQF